MTFFEARSVEWRDGVVRLLDQNALPWEKRYVECRNIEEIVRAIKDMTVRGAPAIGVAAAMGIALAAMHSSAESLEGLLSDLRVAAETLSRARPTARNLFWAIERMIGVVEKAKDIEEAKKLALREALKMAEEDFQVNKRIGDIGAELVEDGDVLLTHCKQLS